jgi:hypothetical protein
MDKLLERSALGAIFRHLISGLVFTMAAIYVNTTNHNEFCNIASNNYSILAVVSLVAGTLIYGLHRGLSNPISEYGVYAITTWSWLKWTRCVFFPTPCLDSLVKRWEARRATEKDIWLKHKVITDHIMSWADYIHLLYTSAFAVWLGSLTLFATCNYNEIEFDWLIFLSGFVLLLGAGVNDARKYIAEERWHSELIKLDIADQNDDGNDG